MNTKHIAVIFTALLSVFTMGCESFLKTDPPLDISNEIALSTPAGIGAALVGAADGMQSGALFGGNTISIGELWSNNVEASVGADFGRLQIISYNLNIFNPEGRALWQDGYGVINRVNNVLAACENVTFEDPALKQRYRGRALAMRGMTMFQLCTYFAQPWGFTTDNSHPGIVIRTEPTLGDAGTRKARATLNECYEQIVADLTAAAELLPPTDAPFMGALATKAYLARVCFHMGDIVRAEALTTEVINSGAYRLNQDVTSVVSTNSTPEVIWEIINTSIDNAASIVGDFRSSDGATPRYWAGTDFVNAIYQDTADKRLALYDYRDNRLYVKKWERIIMNIYQIRLAEMYLTRADCRWQQSNFTGAIDDVNVIRERAGLKPLAMTLTGNTLLNAIRRERNIELGFEGDSFLERKRQRRNLRQRPWNDAALIFKIPDVEMNANTLCTQNP
jgi:hypothetical protein